MDNTHGVGELGRETLGHNVDVSVATYRRHLGTVAQQGLVAPTSQSLRHSGRLPTLVIPIAILGVTPRQQPRIGQLYICTPAGRCKILAVLGVTVVGWGCGGGFITTRQ